MCSWIWVLMLVAAPQATAQSSFADDEVEIRERVMDYFFGRQNGDQDRLARAFDLEHGDMKFVGRGDNGQTLEKVTLADFRARLNKSLPSPNQGRIVAMDVVDGQMAWVKFQIEAEDGGGFVDYLLLYKRNGSWSVVNKMFVRR